MLADFPTVCAPCHDTQFSSLFRNPARVKESYCLPGALYPIKHDNLSHMTLDPTNQVFLSASSTKR